MLKVLNNTDKPLVLSYLENHHLEVTFLIGNVISFGLENNKNIRRCADYFGYFEENILKGILAFYNLGSCIPHYEDKNAIKEFAELMKKTKFEVLLGMEHIIKPLFEEIKAAKEVDEYSEDSYYVNNNFTPYIIDGLTFLDAKDAPIEKATEFIKKAYADGFKSAKTSEEIVQMLKERNEEEDFILLFKDGELKAQANVQTYTNSINQVGGVFTLSEERGNGYCKATVSEVCRRILERGKTPTLMVRKNNIPAVKAYQALGFKHYDDFLIISFKV
jgi:RimJ/RimL family protein N-acetyltransferase